ncbi:MAG: hypothetical protein ACK4G2_04860 [Novosphingobium sp.]
MTEKAPIDAALAVRGRPPARPLKRPSNRDVDVPIDHHPGTIRGDGPSAQSARAAMTAMHDAWTRIAEAAADEGIDPPRLAKAAQSAMERALTAADRATSAIDGRVKELETAITAAVQPRVDPTLAAEVRAYWREKGWASGLVEALRADARTASAILSAPGYLSGLDAERLETMRRIAVDAHAREHQAALDEALHARRKVETASGRMIELVAPRLREWSEPESERLAKLEALGRG